MPELPEVETIARKLRPELVGKRITKANLLWSRTLATPTPTKFEREIVGQEIKTVGRRAKYVHIQLSAYHLFVHLRMSGDLYIKEGKTTPEKHDRLIFTLTTTPLRLPPFSKKIGGEKEGGGERPGAREFSLIWACMVGA